MTTIKKVQLKVIDTAPTEAGYKSTKAGDKIYYFKYTGGDSQHDDGTVTQHTDLGDIDLEVELQQPHKASQKDRYRLHSVKFHKDGEGNDGPKQLSMKGLATDAKLTIHNKNKAELNGRYNVMVVDTKKGDNEKGKIVIECDPPIINKQRN